MLANTLEVRIRQLGWSKEEAISRPPRQTERHCPKLKEVARRNGISDRLFRHRVTRLGWDPQRAATTPFTTREQRKQICVYAKSFQEKFPRELLATAKLNGIAPNTFYKRVRSGWNIQRAATEPIWTDSKKGSTSVKKIKKREEDRTEQLFGKGRK